jgi:hypothetical protein
MAEITYANWRDYIGPAVRGIWHTLTDEQKVTLATDAYNEAIQHDHGDDE